MGFSIRAATAEDLEPEQVSGVDGVYRDRLTTALATGCTVLLATSEADGVIGRITVDLSGRDAELWGLGVSEQLRRRGVGSALIAAAELEVRRRGLAEVRLTVAKTNQIGLDVYDDHGYVVDGEAQSTGRTDPDGRVIHAPEPVWTMVKRLA